MSAQVLGCGHASCLFESDFLQAAPQIHLHFLTEDSEEEKRDGHSKVEICCHGCGQALILTFNTRSADQAMGYRNRFASRHKFCKNLNFENKCPDYRSSIQMFDLRVPKKNPLAWSKSSQRQTKPRDKVPTPKGTVPLRRDHHHARK